MKIILSSIGTRGDMEPFLAIAEILKKRGHEVICLFPEQFRDLAMDSGFGFESLGPKFMEMIDSEDGKAALGGAGGGLKKVLALIRLARNYGDINKELVERQYQVVERENPDRIIHNGKAIYPMIWGVKHPGKNILVSPVPYLHYVKGHSHLAFNRNFGTFFNKLTFSIARVGLLSSIMKTVKWLGLQGEVSKRSVKKAMAGSRTIYTISPTLFPRPRYWEENLQVLGYHERDKQQNWKPGPDLLRFLAKHPRIMFVTFGSMTNPVPEEKTRIILKALQENNIPALINTAAGGLKEPEAYDRDLFHFVSQIPYDWVLPKMYAMVHHGGSGTTHMGLKFGLPTMIVPHIIDQFVWNKLIFQLGAGPRGIRIDKITTQNLGPKLADLFQDEGYKARAAQLAEQMAKEDLTEKLVSNLL